MQPTVYVVYLYCTGVFTGNIPTLCTTNSSSSILDVNQLLSQNFSRSLEVLICMEYKTSAIFLAKINFHDFHLFCSPFWLWGSENGHDLSPGHMS